MTSSGLWVSHMRVLGHWLQNDGSIQLHFDEALQNAWNSFYANCAGVESSKLTLKTRLLMISRAVTPVLRFKWARWPFTTSRALQLDAVQRRMFGILLRLQRCPGQEIDAYVRRRGRCTADLQRQHGSWSAAWAKSVGGW